MRLNHEKMFSNGCLSEPYVQFGAPGGIRTRDLRLSCVYAYKAAAITGLSHRGFTKFSTALSSREIFFMIVAYRVSVCESYFESIGARQSIEIEQHLFLLFLSDHFNALKSILRANF